MKAKKLLEAHFYGQIFKGRHFEPICNKVLYGEIKPQRTYIQTFDDKNFWGIEASVVFETIKGEKCYLYEIN